MLDFQYYMDLFTNNVPGPVNAKAIPYLLKERTIELVLVYGQRIDENNEFAFLAYLEFKDDLNALYADHFLDPQYKPDELRAFWWLWEFGISLVLNKCHYDPLDFDIVHRAPAQIIEGLPGPQAAKAAYAQKFQTNPYQKLERDFFNLADEHQVAPLTIMEAFFMTMAEVNHRIMQIGSRLLPPWQIIDMVFELSISSIERVLPVSLADHRTRFNS